MAEVTLHLVDPQVYEGKIDTPVIDIRDEMPTGLGRVLPAHAT